MITRRLMRQWPALAVPQLNMIFRRLSNNTIIKAASEVDEFRKKQLWLKFKDKKITKDAVMKLTDGIQGINIVPRSEGCFVYINFPSEEIAETKYAELRRAGIWVDYCGTKMGKPKRLTPGDAWQSYTDKDSDKKLRLRFSAIVTEEEIRQLSDEIKNVKVRYHDSSSKVIVEFETPEQAEKHYDLFQIISVREWPARVYRCKSEANTIKEATELLVKDLKESETEADLIEMFPEAKEVFTFHSLFNQRWARVKFENSKDCLSAFESYMDLRKVSLYREFENKGDEQKPFNRLELRIRLMPWHTRQVLRKMFKRANNFRYYNRLNTSIGMIQRFAFVTFSDEEDCRRAANMYKEFDIQYSFEAEFDYKTLVLNGISEWDTAESVHQLFPEADKVYIHKTVSEVGDKTLRNAFIIFDSEEKCKRALDANVRRRLYYRVKP